MPENKVLLVSKATKALQVRLVWKVFKESSVQKEIRASAVTKAKAARKEILERRE